MTDETKPKRMRGQKEREAAYRQGFADGLAHAVFEIRSQNEMAGKREEAMAEGLVKLRGTPMVRRARRKKDEKPPPPAIMHSSASA